MLLSNGTLLKIKYLILMLLVSGLYFFVSVYSFYVNYPATGNIGLLLFSIISVPF